MTITLQDLDEAIQQAAIDGVASVTVAGSTTVTKPLADLIAWRKELERIQGQQNAASNPGRGLYFTKLVPPGCG